MKTIADDRLKAPLNCVLLSAILLYMLLPFMGVAAWHRVVPEHDHLFVNGDHHHDEPSNSNGEMLPAPQNIFNDCVGCDSSQPSITVVHLPNPTGSLSLFALVIGFVASFVIDSLYATPCRIRSRAPEIRRRWNCYETRNEKSA
jgi:hypothetical protein